MTEAELRKRYHKENPGVGFELWAEMEGFTMRRENVKAGITWQELLFHAAALTYLWGLWEGVKWVVRRL